MARITGDKEHEKRLQKLYGLQAQAEIAQGLFVAGSEIETEAQQSITEGSISGKGHVPSAPGEPPNADTRLLDTSIDTVVISKNPATVHVISNAPYSAALEFGTSKMEERPFMRPAAQKKRKRVLEIIAAVVRVVTR